MLKIAGLSLPKIKELFFLIHQLFPQTGITQQALMPGYIN